MYHLRDSCNLRHVTSNMLESVVGTDETAGKREELLEDGESLPEVLSYELYTLPSTSWSFSGVLY